MPGYWVGGMESHHVNIKGNGGRETSNKQKKYFPRN